MLDIFLHGSCHASRTLALLAVLLAVPIAESQTCTQDCHLLVQLVQDVLLFSLKLILQVHLFCIHLVALKIKLCQLQITTNGLRKALPLHVSVSTQDIFRLSANS